MSDAQSSLELVRLVSRLVRFLAMYGEEHQQPRAALDVLKRTLDEALRAAPKIAIALQGPALVVQGHFMPPQDSAVGSLAATFRTHSVNSLSFLPGVASDELVRIAKLLAAKPQEALVNGELRPELLQGLIRVHVNDIRFVAVEETQAVVDATQVLPFNADTTSIRIARPRGPAGDEGGGASADATAVVGLVAEGGATVTIPFAQLVSLLQSRGAAVGLPEARQMALKSLAGHIDPGGGPLSDQIAKALEQLPEELRRELDGPAGRAELSAVVLARQFEGGAATEALEGVVHELAPRLGDAVPLLETLSRLLRGTGRSVSLESLERVMKLIPDVNRLEEVLQGEVLVVDGDAARRDAYVHALSAYGYVVEVCPTGAAALERVEAKQDFAAVVTDILLPDMPCGRLLEKLRRQRPSPPVVVASPRAEAAKSDFDIVSYPTKRIVPSHDPAAVAEAVRAIAVQPSRPEAEADREDREKAHEIQSQLIPKALPPIAGWDAAFAYKPAKEVGGDYLDVFPVDAERIGFVVGDVSGKGFSAALVMVMVRSAFRLSAPGGGSVRDTIAAVNRLVRADIKRGMFVSVVFGCLHVPSGALRIVNCGHNPPVVMDEKGGKARMLPPGGMPLGVADPARFDPTVKEEELALPPGGRIVLYTDGVVEAMSAREREFGEKAFLDLVTRSGSDAPRQLVDSLLVALGAHRGGAPQSDDITILDLRRLPV
jgi:serine phosphatase RsbU (regulator of sigma subunit)